MILNSKPIIINLKNYTNLSNLIFTQNVKMKIKITLNLKIKIQIMFFL